MFSMSESGPFHAGVRTQRRLKLKIIIIRCLLTFLLAHANNQCLHCSINQLLTHKSCCRKPTIELFKCFFSVNSFFDLHFDALVAF